jgi:hypothetical protein
MAAGECNAAEEPTPSAEPGEPVPARELTAHVDSAILRKRWPFSSETIANESSDEIAMK